MSAGRIIEHIVVAALGAAMVLSVLISALETVVLPRDGFTRVTRFVFAVTDRILVRRWRNRARRQNQRALYGPVALVSLPLAWMLLATVGFSCIYRGISDHDSAQRSFEISGSSLFTLGFAEPDGTARIWLTFVEATIGLGLVALLISYLPTIYAAHHEREKGISVLRPFAGTPPDPAALLSNLYRLGTLDNPDLWRTAAGWMLDRDQTHTAFPALCCFPESSPEQSWVASFGSMLDAAAILLSTSTVSTEDHASDEIKGPMMARPTACPPWSGSTVPPGSPSGGGPSSWGPWCPGLGTTGRSPPSPSPRTSFVAAIDHLSPLLAVPEDQRDGCWRGFAWIRSGHDLALRGLAGLTLAEPAPWTTDRPAVVGRPRILSSREIAVEWVPPARPGSPGAGWLRPPADSRSRLTPVPGWLDGSGPEDPGQTPVSAWTRPSAMAPSRASKSRSF